MKVKVVLILLSLATGASCIQQLFNLSSLNCCSCRPKHPKKGKIIDTCTQLLNKFLIIHVKKKKIFLLRRSNEQKFPAKNFNNCWNKVAAV